MQTSKFSLAPRIKTRTDECEIHGEYTRKLVEAFTGDPQVIGCPRCRWEAIHMADVDSQEHVDAVASKKREDLNAALFATGISARFRPCTLDNFLAPMSAQELALSECRAYVDQFAENLSAGRCVLLLGNFGNGKTHLGCAMLKAVVERFNASALYVPASDIIAALKASFSRDAGTSESEILASLSTVDLLLVDELGAQGGTEFERQSLHQIIDARYRNQLPTIITSNLPPAELAAYIGDRALDRLRENGGQAVSFDWESARGKS